MSSEWKMVRLGDCATFINGKAFKPSEWSNTGIPIIRIQNLTGSSCDTNYYEGDVEDRYKVYNDDILISWSASLGVFVWNRGEAVLNQHIFRVEFNKLAIDKRYFYYLVKNSLDAMALQTHGATMKHITKGKFDNIKVPYFSISKQREIAAVLDKASELVEKRKAQLAELDRLAESIFYDMFGDPVTNPKGWEKKKLNVLGRIERGKSKHRPRNAPELLGGKYPLIQTGDVANSDLYIEKYDQTYSDLGLAQSRMWDRGTLCITIAANIAKTSILSFNACFPDSVVGFVSYENTNSIFIHYWFSFFQEIIEKQAPEVAQKNINLAILSDLDIITPSFLLQQQFAERIEKIEVQKTKVKAALKESEDLFQRLMQDMFKPGNDNI